MKTAGELKPNFAPTYAAIYPGLCEIFHRHGYALAVHGSLARDFDVVAIPWADKVSPSDDVIKEVTTVFAITQIGEPQLRSYGRMAYTLSIGFGSCSVDLSFFPHVL